MFGFQMFKKPVPQKDAIDDILARHRANLAAERAPALRSDPPPAALKKKPSFGRRSATLETSSIRRNGPVDALIQPGINW